MELYNRRQVLKGVSAELGSCKEWQQTMPAGSASAAAAALVKKTTGLSPAAH